MRSPMSLCHAALAVAALSGCVTNSSQGKDGGDLAEVIGPPYDLSGAPNDLQISGVTISGVSPESGPFAGATSMTVTGSGFRRDATVKIGGVAANSVQILSLNQISLQTPPSTEAVGLVPLTVTNGDGTTATVSRFRYVAEKLRFKVPSKVQLSSDEEASYGALGDFNGDGVLDLLVSETSKDGLIVVLANDKAFASKRYAQTASQPKGVATGDFDGDGRVDAAVAQYGAGSVRVLLGDGTGFLPSGRVGSANTAGQPLLLLALDLNGDKRPELVALSDSGAKVEVLTVSADANAVTVQNRGGPALPAAGRALAAGDVNGDGRPDVAAASVGGKVSVLLAQADGTLSKGADFDPGVDTRGLALADIDGDGKLDLLAVGGTEGKLMVLRGDGKGSFDVGGKASVNVGASPIAVVAVDLDGDGKLDVAVANSGSNDVMVLGNKGGGVLEARSLAEVTIITNPPGTPDIERTVMTLSAGGGMTTLLAAPLGRDLRTDLLTINSAERSATTLYNVSR